MLRDDKYLYIPQIFFLLLDICAQNYLDKNSLTPYDIIESFKAPTSLKVHPVTYTSSLEIYFFIKYY